MTWTNEKFIQQMNIIPIKKKSYLSKEWVFAKPLSIMGTCRLNQFKSTCYQLENFFASIGTQLNEFNYHAGEYSAALNLTFHLEDGAILQKYKRAIYWFLTNYLPVTYRIDDWMSDDHMHQCISSLFINTTKGYSSLRLVLDFDSYEVEYPSHDFFCISEDLMHQRLAA